MAIAKDLYIELLFEDVFQRALLAEANPGVAANKMVDNIEAKSGKKYSKEERGTGQEIHEEHKRYLERSKIE